MTTMPGTLTAPSGRAKKAPISSSLYPRWRTVSARRPSYGRSQTTDFSLLFGGHLRDFAVEETRSTGLVDDGGRSGSTLLASAEVANRSIPALAKVGVTAEGILAAPYRLVRA